MQLSFDIEDTESELPLTANFILVNASDPGSVTSGLLDFLHDSNCRLTVFPIPIKEICLSATGFLNSIQNLLNLIS